MTQTAKTYANALYDLAKDEQLVDKIRADLALMQSMFSENPTYLRLLSSPSLPKAERKALLDEAFSSSVHAYSLNFVKMLCDNGTLSAFSGCVRQMRNRYNEDHHILDVCAISAIEIPAPLQEKLIARLCAITGKTVELRTRIQPEILGGIRLELPDRQLDGTVQGHLSALQKQLRELVL